MINDGFAISQNDVNRFNDDGFVVLRDFFSEEFIAHLKKLAYDNVESPESNYGAGFSKLKYDVGNADEKIFSLIQNDVFKDTLHQLTSRNLIYTQGLSFALEKNVSSGFPWHVGTQSFGFQRKEDFSCTIWAPFCEINPQGQRGGMAYISKKHMSGDFVYQYINLIPDHLKGKKRKKRKNKVVDFDDFSKAKNSILNSPDISDVLESFAVEDYFSPRDVIVFDKYVVHRSVKLEEGEIGSWVAFALRFADVESTYDLNRANQLEYPKHEFDYAGSSDFNIKVCSKDGQKITESDLYSTDLHKRTINGY